MKGKGSISEFDHTADVGYRVTTNSMEDLFRNAAVGMFHVILDEPHDYTDTQTYSVTLVSSSLEFLLHDWLTELLFLHARDHVYFIDCTFTELHERSLEASVNFITMTDDMIAQATEVKAVTYHEFFVRATDEGYEAQIVLDM